MPDTEDFASLLREFETTHADAGLREPKVGEKVSGRVVNIGDEHLFIEIGAKSEGTLDRREVTDETGELTVNIGDTIETTVIGSESGTLVLSCGHAQRLHGSAELEHAFRHHLPVEGLVSGTTKGGVEVQIAGVRAFCPISQLDLHFVEDAQPYVGQHLEFHITKYQGGRHTDLVVSRRSLLEEEQKALAEATRAQLEVGAVLQGRVTSIRDYGAFVDLGGIEGMIHISELAFGRVSHPGEVVSEGQSVEVAVLRIEKSDNPRHPEKIALSLRALAKDPWLEAERLFPAGCRAKGKVTRLQPFGAFIELAPGIEGLAHVSELVAGRRITHPNEVLHSGDEVEVTVLTIEPDKRRISLTLKTVSAGEASADETPPPENYAAEKKSFGTLGDLLKQELEKKG